MRSTRVLLASSGSAVEMAEQEGEALNVPTTYEAVVIVALIFVPGLILGQIIRQAISFYPEQVHGWHFLAIGATGLFLHTLAFPLWTRFVVDWYVADEIDDHWLASYAWFLAVIFVWPVAAGKLVVRLLRYDWVDRQLDKIGMAYVDRTPTAWDWAVRTPETRWVVVHLNDGTMIGGWFGRHSFASLYRSKRDIYLEQMWLLDENGTFIESQVNTDGVWIGHDAISRVVFQIGQDDEGGST